MKRIPSAQNPLYKEYKKLATSASARRKAGRTLLDGVHLAEAYLQHIGSPRACIVADESHIDSEIADIIRQCEQRNVPVLQVPITLYEKLSSVENGTGLMFDIEIPTHAVSSELTNNTVVLDNVQDPGNVGTILRTAAAAGVEQILCSRDTASVWAPKVLRAGMGAQFILDIYEGADIAHALALTQLPVIATSSHAKNNIYDIDLSGPVVWLFGNEGQGVSRDLLQHATHEVSIPQLGDIESLNVSISAGICLFEQVRQKVNGSL